MSRRSLPRAPDPLGLYRSAIGRYPLLAAEEEQRLARAYANGDARAAERLITANLRFVVKIAYEYRSSALKMADLVQEGTIGLMRALQRFDPDRGIRLVSYAAWWIRASIQSHILTSFSLVKLGTTQAQRKLFFALARARRELDRLGAGPWADLDGEDHTELARMLGVKPAEVAEMTQRMRGGDLSLHARVIDGAARTHADLLPCEGPSHDDQLSAAQEQLKLERGISAALAQLDPRERFIVEQRVLRDDPPTLKGLGEHFGFSLERARQLEIRALEKLRETLRGLAIEVDWPTEGAPAALGDRAAA